MLFDLSAPGTKLAWISAARRPLTWLQSLGNSILTQYHLSDHLPLRQHGYDDIAIFETIRASFGNHRIGIILCEFLLPSRVGVSHNQMETRSRQVRRHRRASLAQADIAHCLDRHFAFGMIGEERYKPQLTEVGY